MIISKCPKRAHQNFAWLIFDSNVPYLQFHSFLYRQFVLWLLFLVFDNCKKDIKILGKIYWYCVWWLLKGLMLFPLYLSCVALGYTRNFERLNKNWIKTKFSFYNPSLTLTFDFRAVSMDISWKWCWLGMYLDRLNYQHFVAES